jgi:hypothetical protein
MGKVFAISWSRVIDRAHRPLEKGAAARPAPQNQSLIDAVFGVVAKKFSRANAQKPRKLLYVATGKPHSCDPAAISTFRTVDLLFDSLCDLTEPALDKVVPLEMLAETLVFVTFVLPKPANLD